MPMRTFKGRIGTYKPFGSNKGYDAKDAKGIGFDNDALDGEDVETEMEDRRQRKLRSQRAVRQDQSLTQILKLQQEYQMHIEKEQKEKQEKEAMEKPFKSASHLETAEDSDSESSEYGYPPTSGFNMTSKLSWVDSITSSLNSSFTSQSRLIMDSHSTGEVTLDEAKFEGRIKTEELITKVNEALKDIHQNNCIVKTVECKQKSGLESKQSTLTPEDQSEDQQPSSLAAEKLSTVAVTNDIVVKSDISVTDEILTPDETHDLIECLNTITGSDLDITIENNTEPLKHTPLTPTPLTHTLSPSPSSSQCSENDREGAGVTGSTITVDTELQMLELTLVDQRVLNQEADNPIILSGNTSDVEVKGHDGRTDSIQESNQTTVNKGRKKTNKKHCCKIS